MLFREEARRKPISARTVPPSSMRITGNVSKKAGHRITAKQNVPISKLELPNQSWTRPSPFSIGPVGLLSFRRVMAYIITKD